MTDTLPELPEPDAYGPSADYSERTEPHYRADTVRRLLAECRRQALEEAARVCEEDAFVDQWRGLAEAAERIRTLKDKP